jgi:hypothetical protein
MGGLKATSGVRVGPQEGAPGVLLRGWKHLVYQWGEVPWECVALSHSSCNCRVTHDLF